MQKIDVAALPHSYMRRRSARVKFQGSLLALVQLDNGSHLRVPVHQLSSNGGLLKIADPLGESEKVEVALHVGSTTLRGEAEMLEPMWATTGYLQPFRFTDLPAKKQTELKQNLECLLKAGRGRRAIGLHWTLANQ
ncbi:MAG TPA: hypothetical protein VMT53_27450 [Terriglobales bacterium]|nr:hypothetical protein [Terriglobales bacterium]